MFPRKREVPPPLVVELAADKILVTVTCRLLGFSTQTFYEWRKDPVSRTVGREASFLTLAKFVPDRVLDTAFAAALRRAGTSSRPNPNEHPSSATTGSRDAAAVGS